MKINNNIPAFPRSRSVNHSDEQDGMSLLDYFAGQIAAKLAPSYTNEQLKENPQGYVAGPAYEMAAAMLEERKKYHS
jgi:hypothetical protein